MRVNLQKLHNWGNFYVDLFSFGCRGDERKSNFKTPEPAIAFKHNWFWTFCFRCGNLHTAALNVFLFGFLDKFSVFFMTLRYKDIQSHETISMRLTFFDSFLRFSLKGFRVESYSLESRNFLVIQCRNGSPEGFVWYSTDVQIIFHINLGFYPVPVSLILFEEAKGNGNLKLLFCIRCLSYPYTDPESDERDCWFSPFVFPSFLFTLFRHLELCRNCFEICQCLAEERSQAPKPSAMLISMTSVAVAIQRTRVEPKVSRSDSADVHQKVHLWLLQSFTNCRAQGKKRRGLHMEK